MRRWSESEDGGLGSVGVDELMYRYSEDSRRCWFRGRIGRGLGNNSHRLTILLLLRLSLLRLPLQL